MAVIPLTRRPGGLQAVEQSWPPERHDREPGPCSHEGYHWLYVLGGRLRVILGDQDLVQSTGEVAEFDTHLPHWFGNAEPRPVEFLSLPGPQGERFRIRARYRPNRRDQPKKSVSRSTNSSGCSSGMKCPQSGIISSRISSARPR